MTIVHTIANIQNCEGNMSHVVVPQDGGSPLALKLKVQYATFLRAVNKQKSS